MEQPGSSMPLEQCPAAVATNMRRANFIGIVWAIPRIIAMIVVLSFGWDQECDRPLKLFLLVLCIQDLLRIPTRLHVLQKVQQLERDHDPYSGDFELGLNRIQKSRMCVIGRMCSHVVLGWYIVGIVWLFSTRTCSETAPSIYMLCLALIIILFTFLGINFMCGCVYLSLVVLVRVLGRHVFGHQVGLNAVANSDMKGASNDQIAALHTFQYQHGDTPDATVCAICLCDYEHDEEAQDEMLTQLPCKHNFHSECVASWLKVNDTCPTCRCPVSADPNAPGCTDNKTAAETDIQGNGSEHNSSRVIPMA